MITKRGKALAEKLVNAGIVPHVGKKLEAICSTLLRRAATWRTSQKRSNETPKPEKNDFHYRNKVENPLIKHHRFMAWAVSDLSKLTQQPLYIEVNQSTATASIMSHNGHLPIKLSIRSNSNG